MWPDTNNVKAQNKKCEELMQQLSAVERPDLVFIKPDVEEFLQTFFYGNERRKLCAYVKAREHFISVIFHEEDLYCEFNFLGNGQWVQSLNYEGVDWKNDQQIIKVDVVETGRKVNVKEEVHYFFYIEPSIQKKLSLPTCWQKQYDDELRLKKWQVAIKWETDRYDGPLSGYCEIGRRLYYFDCVEEKEFNRARMYAVYPLSVFEELVARWKRFKYEAFIQRFEFLYRLYWWSMLFQWWHRFTIDKRKEKYVKLTQRNVAGYFSLGE